MAGGDIRPAAFGETYRLKITIRNVRPAVWRQLEVAGSTSLCELHEAIQTAFGWFDAHLHEFRIDGRNIGEPDPEWDREVPVEDDRRAFLALVGLSVGGRFLYLYDFGDGWEHDIEVEAIEPAGARIRYPRVLGGARACPPEDVGGPLGYSDFLKAYRDPRNDEHEAMVEWAGPEFDPGHFDPRDVNDAFDMLEQLKADRRAVKRAKRAAAKKKAPRST